MCATYPTPFLPLRFVPYITFIYLPNEFDYFARICMSARLSGLCYHKRICLCNWKTPWNYLWREGNFSIRVSTSSQYDLRCWKRHKIQFSPPLHSLDQYRWIKTIHLECHDCIFPSWCLSGLKCHLLQLAVSRHSSVSNRGLGMWESYKWLGYRYSGFLYH